jgi:chloramphenicol O-acetyltransferase type A
MIWGRYRKRFLRYYLPISFQFHHVQMDGGHGATFLEQLQKEINRI